MKIKNLVYIFIILFGFVLSVFTFIFIVKQYPSTNLGDIFNAGLGEPIPMYLLLVIIIIVLVLSFCSAGVLKIKEEEEIKKRMLDLLAEQNIKDYPTQIVIFVVLGGILSASIWTLITYSIGMIILDPFQLFIIIITLIVVILLISGYYFWSKIRIVS